MERTTMKIKVLGPGCMNCKTLETRTQEAVAALQVAATVEKVQDIMEIATYGILRTPGLVIDETVVSSGRVPTIEEIKGMILTHSAKATS
jgi:small redox-active disulfide protein 2